MIIMASYTARLCKNADLKITGYRKIGCVNYLGFYILFCFIFIVFVNIMHMWILWLQWFNVVIKLALFFFLRMFINVRNQQLVFSWKYS